MPNLIPGNVGESRTIRTDATRDALLAALRQGMSVATACVSAGVGKSAAYAWRRDDPDLAAAWDAAYEYGTALAADEARRRAVDGVERRKPITYQGQITGYDEYREYSDDLLKWWLSIRDPDTYGRRDKVSVEHTGTIEHDHRVQVMTEPSRISAVLDLLRQHDPTFAALPVLELPAASSE